MQRNVEIVLRDPAVVLIIARRKERTSAKKIKYRRHSVCTFSIDITSWLDSELKTMPKEQQGATTCPLMRLSWMLQ